MKAEVKRAVDKRLKELGVEKMAKALERFLGDGEIEKEIRQARKALARYRKRT